MRITGRTPDENYVEIVEAPDHPWFLGCQFHPEFKSKPLEPHPLFAAFIGAALEHKLQKSRPTATPAADRRTQASRARLARRSSRHRLSLTCDYRRTMVRLLGSMYAGPAWCAGL